LLLGWGASSGCKKLGLRCTQVQPFTTTTEFQHALTVAENVLAQTVVATRPNETWVTDITYVPITEGWLYLVGIKDLFTCEVVGHALDARMTTDLVWGGHSGRPSPASAQDWGSCITPIAHHNIATRIIRSSYERSAWSRP
jgi:transposase InsO family protein